MARTYHRDSRGRFASGGGGASAGKAAKKSASARSGSPAAPRQAGLKKGKAAKSPAGKGAANAIKPSPLRLNAEERAYAKVALGKKLSDRKFRAAMEQLGVKGMTQGKLLRISRAVSSKMRHDPIEGRAALKEKLAKVMGVKPKKRR